MGRDFHKKFITEEDKIDYLKFWPNILKGQADEEPAYMMKFFIIVRTVLPILKMTWYGWFRARAMKSSCEDGAASILNKEWMDFRGAERDVRMRWMTKGREAVPQRAKASYRISFM